ncbi:MAG TPA: GNAT family N-acetyltransferase [Conexibacter sp.]|nr:GNAT family N-acetyltransferase [Conexibacter sp.]
MSDAELITDLDGLAALTDGWDALAAENGLPHLAPAWVLAWWHHVPSPETVPRTIAVRDGDELIGLAPLAVTPGSGRIDYRVPGIEIAGRLAPLARAGREWEVAEAIGETLAAADPRPDALILEGTPLAAHWPTALRDGWPGALRPPLRRWHVDSAPFVALREPSFDAWLAARSSNFRQQMRRLRRGFAAAGGSSRVSTHATLAADAAAFVRLHTSRWDGRGASNLAALGDRFAALLVEAGEPLLADGRLSVRVLELDGEPVCIQVFLAAGGHVLFVNGGWDERHAKLKPSLVCLLEAVEEAFARGAEKLDLGVGEQPYKLRFADGGDPLGWMMLLPPGPRLPLTAARSAPALLRAGARDAALRALPPEQLERLRTLGRRSGG